MSAWERSLRRSDHYLIGNTNGWKFQKPTAIRRSEVHPSRMAPKPPGNDVLHKIPKLSLVAEEEEENVEPMCDDEVFKGEENGGATRRPRRSRKSTLSIGTVDEVDKADKVSFKPQPRKLKAPVKMRLLLPKADNTATATKATVDCISPIPLPPGVVCIDSQDCYSQDIMMYIHEEDERLAQVKNYVKWKSFHDSHRRHEKSRSLLMEWLIDVLHYFSASQESLYATVHLVDRFLSKVEVPNEDIQLVGVTAVLISTKLEEYYAANISQLVRLTRNCYTEDEVRAMELKMLTSLDFKSYSLDPMLFLNRYIRASLRQFDQVFIEACFIFLDCIISCTSYWGIKTSKKCAAAVYAALNLIPGNRAFKESLWTETLKYYTGYEENQLKLLARQMLDILCMLISSKQETPNSGLVLKYSSRSRHGSFIKSSYCSNSSLERAIYRLNEPGVVTLD